MNPNFRTSRRHFLRSAALAGAALAIPTIIPSSVLGQNAPSQRLGVGLIGMGLMMGGHQGYLTEPRRYAGPGRLRCRSQKREEAKLRD